MASSSATSSKTSQSVSEASTGSPERVLCVGFKNEALKPLQGKTLAEVVGKGCRYIYTHLPRLIGVDG